MVDALHFLLRSIGGFLILLFLARFYLQAFKASFRHPLGQFVLALTNWAVLPARRILPPFRGYDTASFVLAGFTAFLMHALMLALTPWSFVFTAPASLLALLVVSVLELFKMSLYLLTAAVIGQALMSWFSPYNPLMPLLNTLTGPFLRPLRRIIPPVGSVDITPLILLLVIQLFLNVLIPKLESAILAYVSMVGPA
ncbi:YggT family protein [Chitiniphilus shinanonensis]|uniref:YggT family protein n=1 Tax=Chitiniphilus shinanonensis TaxID=553088 RepID=A0ABQ6BSJ7_9NEIS|nr:YggT family protein [Chitiniphilus shinanonensis]GLS04588.1 YggT family protein [Chitiniphilus shinanonensis]